MAEKLTEEQKKDDLDDKVLYETVEATDCPMTPTGKGCGVCDRIGFPLFLVRKAVIKKDYKDISWSKDILKLKDRELDTLSTHEYVYRTLRTGYIYILAKQGDRYECLGYEVTPSGVFRHKTIHNMVERNIRDIPQGCTKKNDHIKGSFITIDLSIHKGNAYIAYTRRAWSPTVVDKYLQAANTSDTKTLQRFSTVILPKEGGGVKDPKSLSPAEDVRTFAFTDFKSTAKLLELELGPNDITYINPDNEKSQAESASSTGTTDESKDTADNGNKASKSKEHFITAHQFNSFQENRYNENKSCVKELYDHVAILEQDRPDTKVGVLVLEDTFGVAEELSYQRQLLVEPLITTIAKAEEQYTNDLDYIYRKELSSQDSKDKYEDLLDKAIKEYKDKHPEEAGYLYDPEIKEGKTYTDIYQGDFAWVRVNEAERYFLDNKYLNDYSPLYLGELSIYTEYFNEKNFHLRKILKYINDYQNQLKARCEASCKPKTIYAFKYKETRATYYKEGYILDENSRSVGYPYGDDYVNYQKVPLSDDEIKRILEKKKSNIYTYVGVTAFKEKASGPRIKLQLKAQAAALFEEEWAKVYARLKLERFKSCLKEQDKLFKQIVDYIVSNSSDYFNYVGWLFGSDKRKSNLLPKVTKYNNVEFWLTECDTNCSNNHVGYLKDFIKIIDFTVVGQVPINEQNAIWDILLRDNTTIYYHLFHGNTEKNFWDLLIQTRLSQDDPELNLTDEKKNLHEALKMIEKKEANPTAGSPQVLDKRFFYEKGLVIVQFYGLIVNKAVAGAAQILNKNNIELDYKMFRSHLTQCLMAFNKCYALCSTISIETKDLSKYIEMNQDQMKVFIHSDNEQTQKYLQQINQFSNRNTLDDITPSRENTKLVFDIFKIAESGRDLYTLYKEIAKVDGFKSFDKFMDAFKQPSVKGLYGLDYGADAVIAFNENSKMMSFGKAMKGELFSGVLNGIAFYLEKQALEDNIAKLEEANKSRQIGQIAKDELINEIRMGHLKYYSSMMVAIDSLAKIANVSTWQILGSRAATITEKITTSAMLKTTSASFVANGILGALSIFEGMQTWKTGNELRAAGEEELATLNQICASVQIFVGVVMLAKTFGVLALIPGGGVLYLCALVLGVVASILTYFIRDKSKEWGPMEIWFNRCLLGNWEYKLKHKPYPANFLGMGVAGNDYIAALMGLFGNIEFMPKEKAYIKKSTRYQDMVEEIRTSASEDLNKYDALVGYTSNDGERRNAIIKYRENSMVTYSKGLYLQMVLPNFDVQNSHFEAELRISRGNESIVLSIQKNGGFLQKFPIIKVISGSLSTFVQRTANNFDDETSINLEQITKSEYYGFITQDKKDPNTGLPIIGDNQLPIQEPTEHFQIIYKLGELYYLSHEFYLKLKYWQTTEAPDSDRSKSNNPDLAGPPEPILPLITTYHYKE